MQEQARLIHTAAIVLGLIFYSDAAEAQRYKHKYHPVTMFIGNFTLDALRSQRGYARLVQLPVLDKADFPQLQKKDKL